MTRTCTVKSHTRKLRPRLDTAKHRQLAAEIGWTPRKPRVRVKATTKQSGRAA